MSASIFFIRLIDKKKTPSFFIDKKLHFKRGFSLLEILVAVGLFSVMLVFISQLARMSMRQYKKIESFVESERVFSGVAKLIFEDLRGANTQFDFNKNLQKMYPVKKREEVNFNNTNDFIWNDEFSFLGQAQELQFASFSISERLYHQQNIVRYFLQECKSLKQKTSSLCFIRALLDSQGEIKKNYVLLREVQSLKFSYYDSKLKKWESQWDRRPSQFEKTFEVVSVNDEKALKDEQKFFPDFVKLDIEWKEKEDFKKTSHQFFVSHPLASQQSLQLLKILYLQKEDSHSYLTEDKELIEIPESEIKIEPQQPEKETSKPPLRDNKTEKNVNFSKPLQIQKRPEQGVTQKGN